MKVMPAPGLKVRHPLTMQFLKPEGEEVTNSSYWMRRLKDGDVVPVPESKPKSRSKPVKVEESKEVLE